MVKKLTSIFLSLSIVASLFAGVGFSASAAAPTSGTLVQGDTYGNSVYYRNQSMTNIVADATWDCTPAKSLIRGKTPEKVYYYVNESFKTDTTSTLNGATDITFGKLADGSLPTDAVNSSIVDLTSTTDFNNDTRIFNSTRLQFGMFVANGELVNDETKQYLQINFELDGEASIDSFFFGSDRGTAGAYNPGHWKFYVADTEAGLFDEANCVAETDMTAVAAYRTITTRLDEAETGKWVGIRIICAYRTVPTNVYPRIDHFSVQGAYTTPVTSANASDYTATSEGDDGTANPQVLSATPTGNTDRNDAHAKVSIDLSTKDSYTGTDGNPYQFKGWYNGEEKVASTATATYVLKGTETTTTYEARYGSASYTVTFKDKNGATITTQTVEHGDAATAPTAPYVAGSVFTGWDVAFDNITADTIVTAQYKTPTHTSSTKVTDDKGNSVYYRNQSMTNIAADAAWDATPAQSLIRGKVPEKVYYYINESFATDETSTLNGATDITFGKLANGSLPTDAVNSDIADLTSTTDFNNDTRIFNSTRLQFGMFVANGELVNDETKQYLQINFELDGEATIDSFFFGSDRATTSAYNPGHWKFYVADTEVGLFDETNCVAEEDLTGISYRTAKTVLSTPKTGKWVGLRIISPYKSVPTSVYPRIDHFSVQGTYAEPVGSVEGVEVNVAKDAAVEAIDNIVVSKSEVDYGNSDRLGNYGVAKVTVTATKTAVKDEEVYAFAGWFNGETLVSSDAEFEYDLTNGSANLTAKYVVYTLTSSKYEIKNGLVKIETGDNASTVIAGFDQDANDIVIKNGETVLQGNDLVNGGMKVELTANGVLADSLDVVHRGDFDGNNEINVTDIFAALDVMADGKEATDEEIFRFDNGDGMLTVTDVVNARKAILGK